MLDIQLRKIFTPVVSQCLANWYGVGYFQVIYFLLILTRTPIGATLVLHGLGVVVSRTRSQVLHSLG